MEMEEIEFKDTNICFKVTKRMNKALDDLMKKKRWRKSAFLRVAIQRELDRIARDEK